MVTSPKIWELWEEQFTAGFTAGQKPAVLMLPAGEEHKRLASVEALAEQLAAAGADRDALLIAFGGGVIGDITGFLGCHLHAWRALCAGADYAARTRWIRPSGARRGVNLAAGKNLVGELQTIRWRCMRTWICWGRCRRMSYARGCRNQSRAGIICDAKLLAYLVGSQREVLALDPEALLRVVGGFDSDEGGCRDGG